MERPVWQLPVHSQGGNVSSRRQPSEWTPSKADPVAPVQPSDDCRPRLHPDYSLMREHKPGRTSSATHGLLPLRKHLREKALFQSIKFHGSNRQLAYHLYKHNIFLCNTYTHRDKCVEKGLERDVVKWLQGSPLRNGVGRVWVKLASPLLSLFLLYRLYKCYWPNFF